MIHIGDLRVGFVGHTAFLFAAPDGTVLLTDPYFCGAFQWQGRRERHMQQPDVRPESIRRCDAIFVSHIHGDHCDTDAIDTIVRQTAARVLAPAEVIECLVARGLPAPRLMALHDGQAVSLGAWHLEILGGYDGSFDARQRMNKFSLWIERGPARLWYSGDCHSLPPALKGRTIDAAFCWTSPDILAAIADMTPRPRRFVIMHHDRHEPGGFWCSRDAEQDAREVSRQLPGVEVVVPDRLGSSAAFAPN
jgi:L-ascorbate metabolism protein UlaG (beta-lactamase superfamily)